MSEEAPGQVPAGVPDEPMTGLYDLADDVLPALIARLRSSRLGELEVRTDAWRVRLRRLGVPTTRTAASGPALGLHADAEGVESVGSAARSPAVGYFTPAPELAVGQPVQAGDLLGSIDVLGIGQEVNSPSDGIVSRLLVEDGQAVEYGQVLAEIDPFEVELDAADADAGGR